MAACHCCHHLLRVILIFLTTHRVELTVNLPKFEPFTRDHHASWVIESRDASPTANDNEVSLPCEYLYQF